MVETPTTRRAGYYEGMIPVGARIRALVPFARPSQLVKLEGGFRFTPADGLMVGTMLIWSINITSLKVVVGTIPPLGFGVIRYSLATVLLFAILRWREGSIAIRRTDLGWVALGGAVGFGLNQMAFLVGIHLVHASLAAIILATAPLITAALAAIWAGEAVRPRTLVSLTVSLSGVIVVIAGAGVQLNASWLGGLLIVGAAATLALSAICAKRPLRTYSSLRVTTWMSLFGALTLLPLGVPALRDTPWAAVSPLIVGATAFTVVGSTVLGNLAWNYAIQQLGAARTSAYTYLQPIMGATIAVILLGERLALLQILGAAVVLLGLLLYPRGINRARAADAAAETVPRR